jgi:hypothetical protein
VASARSRTVLKVSETADGDIEIALVVESAPDQDKRSLVITPQDVPVLIEMLRQQIEDGDPEDRSTLRSHRPVT